MSESPPSAATVQSEVRGRFTPEDCALLDTITLPDAPESHTRFLTSVEGWGGEVRTLTGQLFRSHWEPDATIQGAYDLVGVLFHRDAVESMLPAVPDRLASQVDDVLSGYDAEFRAITVDDVRGEMTRLGDVAPDRPGWWWHRVPDRGPIREELDRNALPATILTTEIQPRFTADELAALDAVTSDPEQRWMRLLVQISGWAAAVHDLEHIRSDPGLRAQYAAIGPRVLLNRLERRDRIEQLLAQLPEPLLAGVRAALDPYDERYRAVTVPDDTGLLPRTARRTRGPDAWWWHRLPSR